MSTLIVLLILGLIVWLCIFLIDSINESNNPYYKYECPHCYNFFITPKKVVNKENKLTVNCPYCNKHVKIK